MLPLAIHHVGIAVADLDAAIATYETRFGLSVVVREVLADQGVEAAALGVGPSQIELIQPTGPEGGVARFLERRGPGLHHVAYAVPDLAGALAALSSSGAELLDREPRRGLGGHLVAFVHPRALDGVLTELVEVHHEDPEDADGVASH
ncbi:MAG: methylmalonyl-CoA epimerase [Actinobacteria bacterium]|nr:methylmalonyl-CoA epimerase [Actinomycetota bacterium]